MDNTQRVIMINTAAQGAGEPTWERLGESVTSFTPSSNSQIQRKFFINSTSARTSKTGEQKQWAMSADRDNTDPALLCIYNFREKKGDKAKTQMIIYEVLDDGEGDDYDAKQYSIIVDVTSDGTQEGENDMTMEATLYQSGDAVDGKFKPSTKKFTPEG